VKTAVVVVNWNSGGRLKVCLESLPPEISIVVVDNASADDSLEQAAAAAVRPAFIRNPSNRGLAAAINQGFAATSTPYVLLLNPDVRVTPGAIQILERTLDANPAIGAVGGYVNDKYLPRRLATPWTVLRENLGWPASFENPGPVGQAAAAALLVRRDAYTGARGFDERFFPAWYEDVDFCRSLRIAGWEVHFSRDAQFIHEGGYSARALGASDFAAAYYRNQLRYVRKHFGFLADVLVRFSIVTGMMGRIITEPSRAGACSKVILGAIGGW
jgi:N-acetylglucosaminyl-diphospho-decaprenol L-rhamnosyltransferase